jgi:uncharacterized membrane protein (DUF2068 family)
MAPAARYDRMAAESTIMGVHRERGLVVIIAYKLLKGGLWLLLALGLAIGIHMGIGHRLAGVADQLRHNAHAWSLALARLLVRASTPRGLWTIVVALVVDGVSSLIEGWALLHGRWWGPWLVVVATGSLLPYELYALVRHPHPSRAALFVVNLAIVVYLARIALRERASRREPETFDRPGGAPTTPQPGSPGLGERGTS